MKVLFAHLCRILRKIGAFVQAILVGKNAQKRTEKLNMRNMNKNAPFCTDACDTPVHYTQEWKN